MKRVTKTKQVSLVESSYTVTSTFEIRTCDLVTLYYSSQSRYRHLEITLREPVTVTIKVGLDLCWPAGSRWYNGN